MFTGIVEETGMVKSFCQRSRSCEIAVAGNKVTSDAAVGDSIAVNGICLTVTSLNSNVFTADIMNETLNRSSIGTARAGSEVNLERAMRADGRFGGHIVSGHIDGTGTISRISRDGVSVRYTISAPESILRYVIEKGSIAIDGISLTVAEVTDHDFGVSVIPHTMDNTILPSKKEGDIVNLENDCIGKYVDKLLFAEGKEVSPYADNGRRRSRQDQNTFLTEDFLLKHGF